MSIYREEALEALIEALRRKQFSNSQFIAIDALSSLIGRITSSGDSYTEAWLLKIAGFDQPYIAVMKAEQLKKDDTELMETMVRISLIIDSFIWRTFHNENDVNTDLLILSYRKKRKL